MNFLITKFELSEITKECLINDFKFEDLLLKIQKENENENIKKNELDERIYNKYSYDKINKSLCLFYRPKSAKIEPDSYNKYLLEKKQMEKTYSIEKTHFTEKTTEGSKFLSNSEIIKNEFSLLSLKNLKIIKFRKNKNDYRLTKKEFGKNYSTEYKPKVLTTQKYFDKYTPNFSAKENPENPKEKSTANTKVYQKLQEKIKNKNKKFFQTDGLDPHIESLIRNNLSKKYPNKILTDQIFNFFLNDEQFDKNEFLFCKKMLLLKKNENLIQTNTKPVCIKEKSEPLSQEVNKINSNISAESIVKQRKLNEEIFRKIVEKKLDSLQNPEEELSPNLKLKNIVLKHQNLFNIDDNLFRTLTKDNKKKENKSSIIYLPTNEEQEKSFGSKGCKRQTQFKLDVRASSIISIPTNEEKEKKKNIFKSKRSKSSQTNSPLSAKNILGRLTYLNYRQLMSRKIKSSEYIFQGKKTDFEKLYSKVKNLNTKITLVTKDNVNDSNIKNENEIITQEKEDNTARKKFYIKFQDLAESAIKKNDNLF